MLSILLGDPLMPQAHVFFPSDTPWLAAKVAASVLKLWPEQIALSLKTN